MRTPPAIALVICCHTSMAETTNIQHVVEQGAQGQFHCTYKGKAAGEMCYVENTQEVIEDEGLIALYGTSKMSALSILWPDGTRSIFIHGDGREICKLKSNRRCDGGFSYKFSEWPEIDYSNGFVILDAERKEYICLWD